MTTTVSQGCHHYMHVSSSGDISRISDASSDISRISDASSDIISSISTNEILVVSVILVTSAVLVTCH